MKKNYLLLRKFIFVIIYTISCLSISSDKLNGYFSCHTVFLYLKFTLIYTTVLISALLLKNHFVFVVKASAIISNSSLVLLIFDSMFTNISGSGKFQRVWWLGAMFLAEAALFTAITVSEKSDYKRIYNLFWYGFTPIYLFTLFLAFLRVPDTGYFSVNLVPGCGTIKYFRYFSIRGREALQNVAGNIVFFIPMTLIMKAYLPKLKLPILLIIGSAFPIAAEAYQFIFKCGNVDIDDIILNWLGLLIGFAVLCIINKRFYKAE